MGKLFQHGPPAHQRAAQIELDEIPEPAQVGAQARLVQRQLGPHGLGGGAIHHVMPIATGGNAVGHIAWQSAGNDERQRAHQPGHQPCLQQPRPQ